MSPLPSLFSSPSLLPSTSRIPFLLSASRSVCFGFFFCLLYLLEIQGAEFGLLPELPLALRVRVVQLAGQLLGVAILLGRSGLVR